VRLKLDNPNAVAGKTIHPRTVKDLETYQGKVFKPAATNTKLGNGSSTITKGRLMGMPMYSLTLTERETCPRSCHHWQDCYGNNMGFASRMPAGKVLESRIASEIADLAKKHKQGFLIRLHVLGDFYSLDYVRLWNQLLREYDNLHVFGYTARNPKEDIIGIALEGVILTYGSRFSIRLSQSTLNTSVEMAQAIENSVEGVSITCPQQTGKTAACVTCGLCWSVKAPIHFLNH
jgi:Gene product 88